MASNSCSVWWNSGLTTSMPALLTMMSSPPKASTVACTAASCSDSCVTSQRTARADSPSSSAASLAPASSMSEIMTLAPRSTNKVAMALPRPWAPPVTSALLPSSSAIAISFRVEGTLENRRPAFPTVFRSSTERSLEKASLLWRPLQLRSALRHQPVPLHGPPHLEGRHRPLQRGAGQLLEPAEPVPHGVLVDVERLGGGLDRQPVLDEGGHGLEHRRRPHAELLERPEVAAHQHLAQLVLGGHGDPQRQVLQPVHAGQSEAFRHLQHPAGGGIGRLDGRQIGRRADADDADGPVERRRSGRDADHVALQDVDEAVLAAGSDRRPQRPDELLGGRPRRRTAPEGDVAQVGREVIGRPEAADLRRGHRAEDQAPQELGPLPFAVTGDLDLGVPVNGGQPHADGVGQRPHQLDHLQRHGRGAAGGRRRLGEELPDLVDGQAMGAQHVGDAHALLGALSAGHGRLGQLPLARQAAGDQRLAHEGAVAQPRGPQRLVAHFAIGRQDLPQRPQGRLGDLFVAGRETAHHRPDLPVPRRPVDPPPRHRWTVEVSNHVVAILEKSLSPGPGPSFRLTRTLRLDVRGWIMSAKPVVVYGASGYTGRLVCEYLREHNIPFVAAGRSKDRLASAMEHNVPGIETADYEIAEVDHSTESLTKLLQGAKVLINTVGPFAEYGHEGVQACLSAGCHYTDTTGEQDWMIECDEKYGQEFANAGLLLSPGIAQMYTTGEIAAQIALEQLPGLHTLDIEVFWKGAPTLASTATILVNAALSKAHYLENNQY